MGGPEKVERETCEHCHYKGLPGGCDGRLAGIAYDCADERNAKIYWGEVRHLREKFKDACNLRDAKRRQMRKG